MRKLFSLLLTLVETTALWAQSFQVGDLYYDITSSSAPYTVEVTYQEQWSSNNYSGLTTATIPENVTYNGTTYSVTSIGEVAFYNCSGLTEVTIPNSVTSIGLSAFYDCSSLTTVICEAIEVPGLEPGVFYNIPLHEATLYVPTESLDDYKAADQWKEFGTILPIEELPVAVENTPSSSSTANTQKLLRNGQLLILRDGKTYNIMGAEIQ